MRTLPLLLAVTLPLLGGAGCAARPAARVGSDAVPFVAVRTPAPELDDSAGDPALARADRAALEVEWPPVTPRAVPPAAVRRVQPSACAPPEALPPCTSVAGPEPCRGVPSPDRPRPCLVRADSSGPVLLRVQRRADPYSAPSLTRRPATRWPGEGGCRPPTR